MSVVQFPRQSDDALFEIAIQAEHSASEARWAAADAYLELSRRGYTQQQIGERVSKSQGHISKCIACAEKYSPANNRPAFPDAYEEVDSKAHVSQNSGDNEWYTPPEYIEAARSVMKGIDLDPASTTEANEVVGAASIFTEEQNGLDHVWEGRVWMNPPYARPLIDSFCAKLAESYAAGEVTQACVLVNNATETGWFHALAEVASAICFPRHRVRFWHPEKSEKAAPLQGQAVIYLGEYVQTFRDEFVRFGFTVTL